MFPRRSRAAHGDFGEDAADGLATLTAGPPGSNRGLGPNPPAQQSVYDRRCVAPSLSRERHRAIRPVSPALAACRSRRGIFPWNFFRCPQHGHGFLRSASRSLHRLVGCPQSRWKFANDSPFSMVGAQDAKAIDFQASRLRQEHDLRHRNRKLRICARFRSYDFAQFSMRHATCVNTTQRCLSPPPRTTARVPKHGRATHRRPPTRGPHRSPAFLYPLGSHPQARDMFQRGRAFEERAAVRT